MPHIESWIPVPPGSDFTIYNLPYGAFARDGRRRLGIAIGDRILDLYRLADAGLFDGVAPREPLMASRLNAFLAQGRPFWKKVRLHVAALLRADDRGNDALRARPDRDDFFVDRRSARLMLPVEIGDYVDFYSSLHHATNLGKIFRPDGEALMPNWRHLPIGYHGRAGSVVISGTPIARPAGQRKPPGADVPLFGPSQRLDIELEVGFITGPGNALGTPISIEKAYDHIFGLVLVNDWSARDIQAWEYQPLGPFLGKSFATTISPWIVTLDALEPFTAEAPEQNPKPLPHIRRLPGTGYDIKLAVDIRTARMRERDEPPVTISRTNYNELYWTMFQQLAHAASNGALIRPGDLFASGTISGSEATSRGSLIEMTWNAKEPLHLPGGEVRGFLEDGDEIVLRGWCQAGDFRIGFGEARGEIRPSPA